MIPVGDVIPSRTTPAVTVALILLLAVAYGTATAMPPAVVAAASLLRLGSDAVSLWLFGPTLEDRLGHARFLGFYMLCGAAGGATRALEAPDQAVVEAGLAAATAGVTGAYFVLYPASKLLALLPIPPLPQIIEFPAVVWATVWTLLQIVAGVGRHGASSPPAATGLAPWPYVAGVVVGMAAVLILRRPERMRVAWWNDRPLTR